VAYLLLCPAGQVQVHVDLTVLPHSSVVVLVVEDPRGPIFKFLVLVLGHQVLVLESQVLDNNTGYWKLIGHSKDNLTEQRVICQCVPQLR